MKTVQELYEIAREAALKEHLSNLECMYSLNKRKIGYILNCMGTVAFYDKKNGEPLWSHEVELLNGYEQMNEFLGQWGEVFALTGDPYRIDTRGVNEY